MRDPIVDPQHRRALEALAQACTPRRVPRGRSPLSPPSAVSGHIPRRVLQAVAIAIGIGGSWRA